MSETELISALQCGDRQALRACYDIYHQRVYNTALTYVQNTPDAEEIVQDVFLEVYQSAKNFKQESSLQTWIYRVTINKSLDRLRYQKRKKRLAFVFSLIKTETGQPLEIPDFVHPGIQLENKEKSIFLFKAINELPEQQKTAFILTQIEDLSQREASVVLNVSEKAMESLVQRAKANLRKKLEIFYPNRRKIKQ